MGSPQSQVPVCDFCGSQALEPVYEVPDSALGIVVAVCDNCGLVQSLPARRRRTGERAVSTSSGATWGNIRHAKGLRLRTVITVLDAHIPWDKVNSVLDVGSNRGDFVQWLQASKSVSHIVGVEPDRTIVEEYRTTPNFTLYMDRFENLNLPQEHFDLVYCSHTLEHADSASAMLGQIRDCMKSGGYLFLEVPNIEVLTTHDIVEEFFMDKHRFHFNHTLLRDYLNYLGFKVMVGEAPSDIFHITLLLVKGSDGPERVAFVREDSELARYNREMIASYAEKLQSNRSSLKRLVENRIHPFMARQKVAFWGAGRLFDALVRYGGLETNAIRCVVDEHLWRIVPTVHGVKIQRPEYLKIAQPDVVIVLARSSAQEITDKAHALGIRSVIKLGDLMTSL